MARPMLRPDPVTMAVRPLSGRRMSDWFAFVGSRIEVSDCMARSSSFENDKFSAFFHLIARLAGDRRHNTVSRRTERMLHLHRLDHQKRLAGRYSCSWLDKHRDHPARHRRLDLPARRRTGVGKSLGPGKLEAPLLG